MNILKITHKAACLLSAAILMASCGDDVNEMIDDTKRHDEPKKGDVELVKPEPGTPVSLTEAERKAVVGQNSFLFRLMRACASSASDNVTLSPLSVSTVLSMAANGADEAVKSQMLKALTGSSLDLDGLNQFNHKLRDGLDGVDNTTAIGDANSLWVASGMTIDRTFAAKNRQYYGSDIFDVDFGAPESVVGEINNWVSEKTGGNIKNFLRGGLSEQNKAVLINVFDFSAIWQERFRKENTAAGKFRNADNTAGDVEMMKRAGTYHVASVSGATVVGIPLGNAAWRMTFILPDEGRTVDETLASLDGKVWDGLTFSARDVEITLPKFEAETNTSLASPLQAAGMTLPFMGGGFPYMFANSMAGIDDLLHCAKIKIDENGVRASAASAIVMIESSGNVRKPLKISFDRPFAYVVEETGTGLILFIGKVGRLG